MPVDWKPEGVAAFSLESSGGRDGSAAAKVSGASSGFAGWSQTFPVRADCSYQVNGWVRTEDVQGAGAQLRVTFTNLNGETVSNGAATGAVSGSQAWKEVSTGAVRAPKDAAFAILSAGLDGSGAAFFDDLALKVVQLGGEVVNLGPPLEDAGWRRDRYEPDNFVGDNEASALASNGWRIYRTKEAGRGGQLGIRLQIVGERIGECTVKYVNAGLTGGLGMPDDPKRVGVPVVEKANYEATWWVRSDNISYEYYDTNSLGGSYYRGLPQEDVDAEGFVPYRIAFTTAASTTALHASNGFGIGAKDDPNREPDSRHTVDVGGYELYPAVEQKVLNPGFEDRNDRPRLVITSAEARELFSGMPARMLVHYPPTQPFGTGEAGPCFLIDFGVDPLTMIQVVEHAVGGLFADPMLSPDGTRLVYGSYPYGPDGTLEHSAGGHSLYAATLRARKSGDATDRADRTLIAKTGFDPRWWKHPRTGEEYIIYVDTPLSVKEDISGTTWIQQVKTGGVETVGAPRKLIPDLAMRGGRSPDGRFICTTLPGLALAELNPDAVENAFVRMVFSGPRVCNGSISNDPAHPDRFLWVAASHTLVRMQERGEEIPGPGNAPGYGYVQWSEWSTAGDWISASPTPLNDDATPSLHDAWVYRFSTKKWTQITLRAGTTHLWVGDGASVPLVPVTPPSAASTPALEPPSTDQPAWAWLDGRSPRFARGPDGKKLSVAFSQPDRSGAAYFARDWMIRVDGGGFNDAPGGEALAAHLTKAAGFTLAAEVTHLAGSGPVVSLGSNLELSISPQQALTLAWKDAGETRKTTLAKFKPGIPVFLTVTLEGEKLRFYANGKELPIPAKQGRWDPGAFQPAPLALGRTDGSSPAWSGELRGLAIYDHVLDPSEIAKIASEASAWRKAQPPVEPIKISARIKEASTIAPPADTVYTRTFAWFLYEIVSGSPPLLPGQTIRVGRWAEMDNQSCLAVRAVVGQVDDLMVEPFEAHPQLESEQPFDTVSLEYPEWWDVSPVRLGQ